jgi:hypothetical protein
MERGNASGTKVMEAKNKSFTIIYHSRPFPTRSSIYFQTNCIRRMKREMKKVMISGPR